MSAPAIKMEHVPGKGFLVTASVDGRTGSVVLTYEGAAGIAAQITRQIAEQLTAQTTPKPWPPEVGTPRVLGIWDADEGEGLLDTYYWDDRWPPPVPDRWLPWPEGGDE